MLNYFYKMTIIIPNELKIFYNSSSDLWNGFLKSITYSINLKSLKNKYALTPPQIRKFYFCWLNIIAFKPIYFSDYINNKVKADIAQGIGASLFYIRCYGWYTGLVSEKLLENNESKTYDHIYPRKQVAHYYLSKKELTLEELIDSFINRFGRTNKITKNENKKVSEKLKSYLKEKNEYLIDVERLFDIILDIYTGLKIKLTEDKDFIKKKVKADEKFLQKRKENSVIQDLKDRFQIT